METVGKMSESELRGIHFRANFLILSQYDEYPERVVDGERQIHHQPKTMKVPY